MRERPCVRCGSRPRADDLFVCPVCADDPVKVDEVRQANEATKGIHDPRERGLAARRFLVETFRWVGHWSPRG